MHNGFQLWFHGNKCPRKWNSYLGARERIAGSVSPWWEVHTIFSRRNILRPLHVTCRRSYSRIHGSIKCFAISGIISYNRVIDRAMGAHTYTTGWPEIGNQVVSTKAQYFVNYPHRIYKVYRIKCKKRINVACIDRKSKNTVILDKILINLTVV